MPVTTVRRLVLKRLFVAYLCVIGANLIFFPHQVYASERNCHYWGYQRGYYSRGYYLPYSYSPYYYRYYSYPYRHRCYPDRSRLRFGFFFD